MPFSYTRVAFKTTQTANARMGILLLFRKHPLTA